MRAEHPQDYLRVAASLLPKELDITDSRLQEVSDDELNVFIEHIRNSISPALLETLESEKTRRLTDKRLRSDLPFFAETTLKLRPKSGPLEPFIFNPAQRKLHEIIEAQKAKTGRVRVIVLKARQLGVSTYVAARLYHRTVTNPGLRTIIIGHERRAFQPVPDRKALSRSFARGHPAVDRHRNAEELIFDKLDSGYIVSVATNEGTGRSATAQLLHASEAGPGLIFRCRWRR